MAPLSCIVAGCSRHADDELTITTRGLTIAYAACSDHATEFRWGRPVLEADLAVRGLIGLRSS